MYYYTLQGNTLVSPYLYPELEQIPEQAAAKDNGAVYFLNRIDPAVSRRSFCLSDPSLAFINREDINLLRKQRDNNPSLPRWLLSRILERKVMAVNTLYPNWKDVLNYSLPRNWVINIAGLGDVGSTLLVGLRLLGGNTISGIGIFSRNRDKVLRWEYEANQILSPSGTDRFPEVRGINQEEIFNCDMFVFCMAASVPPVGKEAEDVRMSQLEANSRIIDIYARMARKAHFKGIFAVVSDPVDLLCKRALITSNTCEKGGLDFEGLAPEQVRGYGLGVMHARAAFYARQSPRTMHYLTEGRAFGPHGEGLVIANSIENYNDTLSQHLTQKALRANLEVRAAGFKPYVAPALSSGSLSILATIRGEWHYSSTFIGGVFMGARNRLTGSGVELERLDLPAPLVERLQDTYRKLGNAL